MSELYNTHDFTPIPETLSQAIPETDESSPAWVHEDARNLLARDSDLEVVATIRRDSMDPAGTYVSDPDEYPLRASVEQFKRSEEHTSELQSQFHLVCRLLLEKKKTPRCPRTERS